MRYKKFLFILFVFIAPQAFSQTDSLAVLKAGWKSTKVDRGIKLKAFCFNTTLFNSNQNITILEVKPGRKNKIDLAYEQKILKKTSQFGQEGNAVASINGTFFDMNDGGSVNYIRSDGMVIAPNRLGNNNKRVFHQQAAIVFKNGKIGIAGWDGTENWEESLHGEDVMVTGPILIAKKQRVQLDSTSFAATRHPRSVLAIKKNKVLLITVDGRNENSAGMSLFELASFLKWLKTDQAINLDGGGSTCLWVDDQPENGVVNYPSDNKKWDHEGERNVANAILVKRRRH